MTPKRPIKLGKTISPKKIISEVNARSRLSINNSKRKVDFLAITKKKPSIESVIKIYRENRGKAEVEIALLEYITQTLKTRQKEWPELYSRWNLFYTLEKIHRNNKG